MVELAFVFAYLPVSGPVRFEPDGMRLQWRTGCAEASYVGDFVAWSDIRDADPSATPPELRLQGGRTVFLAAEQSEELAERLWAAGVTLVHRPDVWGHLLEPFLDRDYDEVKERIEGELRYWGFTEAEVDLFRERVRWRMLLFTRFGGEWTTYGQADLVLAWFLLRVPPMFVSAGDYRRFRRLNDEIADRPTQGGTR
ncbi:hypothetical protein [Allokutzneria sp. NRRL B-24872]|uniref:hypothetical protein n=1 Tax=Allokutzneria sp. NRRL B-24872 TaxID=1137961 RepID=UPI000A3D24E5|nr:hypothetical protein [Allokutzneria sp. NRRL B-24872]